MTSSCPHASSSIAWVDGISREKHRQGIARGPWTLAGDGALTGGQWEALSTSRRRKKCRIKIIVNDNGRSYAPTIGGLVAHLTRCVLPPDTRRLWRGARHLLSHGTPGRAAYDRSCALRKSGIKDALMPPGHVRGPGLKYNGPVNATTSRRSRPALRCGRTSVRPHDHRKGRG